MKWTYFLKSFLIVCFAAFMGFSCGSSGSGGDSGPASNVGPIDDKYKAEDVVHRVRSAVDDGVLAKLSNGTFSNTLVSGISGTASVTGTESSTSGVSCGTDCVHSSYDANVTVMFTNFKFNYASNVVVTLTGSVMYTEHSSSTQSGLSYSSSTSITVKSNGQVQYSDFVTQTYNSYGYQDTITFNASGSNPLNLSGTCTPGNSVTYSF